MEAACGGVHIRANMQASRWTAIASGPDVATAQIEVPSVPTRSLKGPSARVPFGLIDGIWAISDTRRPYAACSLETVGAFDRTGPPAFEQLHVAILLRQDVGASSRDETIAA